MRCSMCGHDSPPGSLFCLNCGNSLVQAGPPMGQQTPGMGPGLPAAPGVMACPTCRAENPVGMKFCRNCGTVLAAGPPGGLPPSPVLGGPGAAPGYGAPAGGYPPPAYPQNPQTAPGGYGAPGQGYPPPLS